MSGDKLVKREQQLAIEHAWRVKGDGSRTNSITGETQQPPERAPVQGYGRGIPWSLHLDAYDAYSKKWGAQIALIDWNGRGCRGGFGTKELDDFIPGWREKVSEIEALKATIEQLQARLAEAEGVRVGQVKAAVGLIHASLFHLRIDDAAEAYHLKAEAFICAAASWLAGRGEAVMCSDCPPADYPTDKTRCASCPRRTHVARSGQPS